MTIQNSNISAGHLAFKEMIRLGTQKRTNMFSHYASTNDEMITDKIILEPGDDLNDLDLGEACHVDTSMFK